MPDEDRTAEITVVRCATCGDTFPTEEPTGARCPSCGGNDVHPATEPLL